MSGGIGMTLNAGAGSIELLYNFWHAKKDDDRPCHYQIKFAFDD